MSLTGCVCGGVPLNSGTSGCIEQIGTWDYIVRVDKEDSTGALNYIPAGTDLTSTYVKAKLNNSDATLKWTVFPKLWSVEDMRADPLTEEEDNIVFNLRQGPRTFVSHFRGKFASPQMEATWMSFECRSNAVYGLTENGQIEGNNPLLAGDLYPIKVQEGSWFANYMKPKKSPESQKVFVRFTVDETEKDATLDFITSDSITYATVNWYSDAPIDVIGYTVSEATAATTIIVIKMKERFGPASLKNDIPGLVIADFSPDGGSTTSACYNVTNSANVTITTVTNALNSNNEIEYTLTMPAQTPADVISIDIFKEGLDMRDALLVTLT